MESRERRRGADCTYEQTMSVATILASQSIPCASGALLSACLLTKDTLQKISESKHKERVQIWGHKHKNGQFFSDGKKQAPEWMCNKGQKGTNNSQLMQKNELFFRVLDMLFHLDHLNDVIASWTSHMKIIHGPLLQINSLQLSNNPRIPFTNPPPNLFLDKSHNSQKHINSMFVGIPMDSYSTPISPSFVLFL